MSLLPNKYKPVRLVSSPIVEGMVEILQLYSYIIGSCKPTCQ